MVKRRGHNEGSYYQTADGRWRAAITLHLPDGQARRRYLSARTKREVQQRAAELHEQARRGVSLEPGRLTVADWLEDWLRTVAAPGVKATTLQTYRTTVRVHLIPALGGHRLTALSALHIQRFYARLVAQGYAPKTVQDIHSVLSSALNAARRMRLIPTSPAADVTLPRRPREERRTLTDEQAMQLLEAAEAAGDPLTALWFVAAYTGMRKGECLGLSWRDVDLDRGLLHVRQQLNRIDHRKVLTDPKGRGMRTIPIATPAVDALRAHRLRQAEQRLAAGVGWQDSGLVFTPPDGTPIEPTRVNVLFDRAIARAGVLRITFHELRHTTATLLLAAGVPLPVVSAILGHAGVQITAAVYAGVQRDDVMRVGDIMTRILRRRA
jgi:integrase